MKKYYVIEKDDTSIKNIENVFEESLGFKSVGTSFDYDTALNTIFKTKPDIIFVNVDTFVSNISEITNELNQFSSLKPLLVAISNSKAKAYDAIKYNFFDYILKPLSELDLRKVLLKFEEECLTQIQYKTRLCLKSYKDYQYLDTDNILFLKADNNATDFHMKNGSIISAYKTLKTFEDALPFNFLRVHKSYIVNSKYVSRINYGKLMCTINANNFNVPFTKTYIGNIESINHTLSNSSFLSLN